MVTIVESRNDGFFRERIVDRVRARIEDAVRIEDPDRTAAMPVTTTGAMARQATDSDGSIPKRLTARLLTETTQ